MKLCKDCRDFCGFGGLPYCLSRNIPVDPVYGGQHGSAREMRNDDSKCGWAGNWFVQKPEPPPKRRWFGLLPPSKRAPQADERPKTLTVPVFLNFDVQLPIGELTLAKGALPPTPDFSIRLAYTQSKPGGPYEVRSAGLVLDLFAAREQANERSTLNHAGT